MLKKINHLLHTPAWLFWLLVVILVLRIPSLFEPYSYGDEMIYLTLGEGIRQRVPLYLGLHDNKPPLLYGMAALAGSLFGFRALLTLWVLVTIYAFWKLVDHLFPKNERLQILSTTVFALLTTFPLLEGNIANSELFMIGPTIFAFYLLLKKQNIPTLLAAGGLLSISALFKMPAIFDVPAIFAYWFLTSTKPLRSFGTLIKRGLWIGIGLAIPIGATFVYYYFRGALHEYVVAAYLQNFGYLSSWRPDQVAQPFWIKNAPLLIRAGVVGVGLTLLFAFRKKLSKQFTFTSTWLLFGLFAVTLSERPYPHYLAQVIPEIALLAGMFVFLKTVEQLIVIVPMALAAFVPVHYHFWYYPSLPYYTRFVNLALGRQTTDEYRQSFGSNVVRNYAVARYIQETTEPTDKIFVWGDNSTIYALAKRLPPIRYVVDYHIKDFSTQEDTVAKLTQNKPTIIVVLPGAESFPALTNFYSDGSYALAETIAETQIWRRLY